MRYDIEREQLRNWVPPDPHRVKTNKRVMQLCAWVDKQQRWVNPDEIEEVAQKKFGVSVAVSKTLTKLVIEVYRKRGQVRGR